MPAVGHIPKTLTSGIFLSSLLIPILQFTGGGLDSRRRFKRSRGERSSSRNVLVSKEFLTLDDLDCTVQPLYFDGNWFGHAKIHR